jgi:hypothetical protein
MNQDEMTIAFYDALVINYGNYWSEYFDEDVAQPLIASKKKAISEGRWKKLSSEEYESEEYAKSEQKLEQDLEYERLSDKLLAKIQEEIGARVRKAIEAEEHKEIKEELWKKVDAAVHKKTKEQKVGEGRLWGETKEEMHERKSLGVDALISPRRTL